MNERIKLIKNKFYVDLVDALRQTNIYKKRFRNQVVKQVQKGLLMKLFNKRGREQTGVKNAENEG